jgi:cysteine-rich repeat protein
MSKPGTIGRGRGILFAGAALLVLIGCDPRKPTGKLRLNGDVAQPCPLVTAVTVLPLEVVVGASVEVDADMTPGALHWLWTANAGHFDNPEADHTRYHCDVGGTQTLTFTLVDGPECEDWAEVRVVCSYSPLCGNARVDPGEQCDDGNADFEDGCSPRCFREPLRARR